MSPNRSGVQAHTYLSAQPNHLSVAAPREHQEEHVTQTVLVHHGDDANRNRTLTGEPPNSAAQAPGLRACQTCAHDILRMTREGRDRVVAGEATGLTGQTPCPRLCSCSRRHAGLGPQEDPGKTPLLRANRGSPGALFLTVGWHL